MQYNTPKEPACTSRIKCKIIGIRLLRCVLAGWPPFCGKKTRIFQGLSSTISRPISAMFYHVMIESI